MAKTKAKAPIHRQRSLIRRSSQIQFQDRHQTAVVLDWDDTLFPTSFIEQSNEKDMEEDERKDFRRKIEECQQSAEKMLKLAYSLGRIMIVTLSGRIKMKRLAEKFYPRVWKFLEQFEIRIVYAMDLHKALTSKDQPKKAHEEFSVGHWAQIKGRAIAKELDSFYSQYQGQTWKNVISIGDSVFECYGTLGAASAYVQRNFLSNGAQTTEERAYVQAWKCFDSDHSRRRFDTDPLWSQPLEGVHDGHMYKVRTKVVKFIDAPSSADLVKQLTLLLRWFPSIVCMDSSLSLFVEELTDERVNFLDSSLVAPSRHQSKHPSYSSQASKEPYSRQGSKERVDKPIPLEVCMELNSVTSRETTKDTNFVSSRKGSKESNGHHLSLLQQQALCLHGGFKELHSRRGSKDSNGSKGTNGSHRGWLVVQDVSP